MSRPVTLSVLALLVLAPYSLAVTAEPGGPVADPTTFGEAIIGFHDGQMPSLDAGDEYAAHEVLEVMARAGFAVVAADDLTTLKAATMSHDEVAYVEDNELLEALFIPDDSRYGSQYGPPMMGAHAAWDFTLGAAATIVAVLDTGIMRSHEDFRSELILQGHDYNNNDNDPADDCGHGTHVAGTVGATTNNALGVAGMAQTTILPMKVLSPGGTSCSGSISDISAAIRDSADQGADIISMSLGGGGFSSTMNNAVEHAWNSGALVVASAGNGGCTNCVGYPAAYDNSIAVAALTSSKNLAGYSSQGPQVEIAAPGSGVLSTYDDGGYRSLSGTSMAAPHVSGALALALAHAPGATNEELRTLMAETAEDLGSPGRDTAYGYGLLRVDELLLNLLPGMTAPDNRVPALAFTWDPSGLDVLFDATGTSDTDGDPLAFSWDFDGPTATGATVTHTFAGAGTHTVKLTVDDGNGGTSSLTTDVTVIDESFPDPDPSVPILDTNTWETFQADAGDVIHFKYLVDEDADIIWTQTDGPNCIISLVVCTIDTAFSVRHGERATGTAADDCFSDRQDSSHTCILDDPAKGWWFLRIDVQEGSAEVDVRAFFDESPPISPANKAPRAFFHYAGFDKDYSFNATNSIDHDGDTLSFAWDFGDGGTASTLAVDHSFVDYDDYTVSLTVTDGNGGTSSLSTVVSVVVPPPNTPPVAVLEVTDQVIDTVSFSGAASSDEDGDVLAYAWDFGDGSTGSGAAVSHTYDADGVYVVELTVSDGNGGSDVATTTVTIVLPDDPDPSTPNLEDGVAVSFHLAEGEEAHYKIFIPAETGSLGVFLDGPPCTLTLCSMDADLYVRFGERATDTEFDCAVDKGNADGACLHGDPEAGWWYVRVVASSGDGDLSLEADRN